MFGSKTKKAKDATVALATQNQAIADENDADMKHADEESKENVHENLRVDTAQQ